MERFTRPREEWRVPETLDSSSDDYLQDPELWVDRLPQPFRMIDCLLQDLLSRAWEEIERRQLQRETERTRVRIPHIAAEAVVEGVSGVQAMKGASGGVVLVGSHDRVRVTDSHGTEMAFSSTDGRVVSLAVEQMTDIHLAAAITESGRLTIYTSDSTYYAMVYIHRIHLYIGQPALWIRCQTDTAC